MKLIQIDSNTFIPFHMVTEIKLDAFIENDTILEIRYRHIESNGIKVIRARMHMREADAFIQQFDMLLRLQ